MAKGKGGVTRRIRGRNGEIVARRGDTLIRNLRKTYGSDFAKGHRSDQSLHSLLKEEGYDSLSEYLQKAKPVRTYTAVIHREEAWYVAECAEIGVVSQGRTIEEALANLKEATELYLEEFPPPPLQRALITTFDVTYA